MGLPSQSSVSSGRSYMYRRRRRRIPRLRVFLLLLVAGVSAWVISGWLDRPPAPRKPDPEPQARADATVSPLVDLPRSLERVRERESGSLGEAVERAMGDRRAPEDGRTPPARVPALASTTREPEDTPSPETGGEHEGERPSNERPGERSAFARLIDEAQILEAKGDPVAARAVLNRALHLRDASDADRQMARDLLTDLNERLVFSPNVWPGDPIALTHTVARGEFLSTIVKKHNLGVDWRAILDINRIPSPKRVREGQTLKLIRGPFHAIVHKRDYRLDLYWGPGDSPSDWIYIRSFPTGLGEQDSTPVGIFRVKNKLANPAWTNPRTGERFSADDPKNPIGEYWVGLEGIGDSSVLVGYGLHGTIDPQSIGQNLSMGCVRLADDDIRLVFGLLSVGDSIVQIRP